MTTWADVPTWGDLGQWFEPSPAFPSLPSPAVMRRFDPGSAGMAPVGYVSASMRPLPRVCASMLPMPDGGPRVGPVSASASGMSTSVSLAPSSRFMTVTAVDAATVSLFLEPAAGPPSVGLAVIYSASEPSYPTPFLWVTPAGDFYLVEA